MIDQSENSTYRQGCDSFFFTRFPLFPLTDNMKNWMETAFFFDFHPEAYLKLIQNTCMISIFFGISYKIS